METTFYRDTWTEICLDAIKNNVISLKEHLPNHVQIIAVVKANAYGHGYVEVAKSVLEAGATTLAVAFLDEAIHLRQHDITCPILVLGASRPSDAAVAANHQIALTVFRKDWLIEAETFLTNEQQLAVHVKCDTGMGRIGVREKEDLTNIETYLMSEPCFTFEGIFTHFSTADEIDLSYTEQQLRTFQSFVSSLKMKPPIIHCANSAASMRLSQEAFNAVRFGVSMYGMSPSNEMKAYLPFSLEPALSWHTKISHVKKLSAHEYVSYGATYETDNEEWIATIPVGYADGWLRKLQKQEVLVDGVRVPIVGRVCMDQCMIRLPYYLPVGTNVTLIGKQQTEEITADELAHTLDTINYEVTCMITARVPRVYLENNEVKKVENSLLTL